MARAKKIEAITEQSITSAEQLANTAVAKQPEPRYSKAQYLAAKTVKEKDLLAALLEDGKTYTRVEADALVRAYKERRLS